MDPQGSVALVTGGGGMLGAASAKRLLEQGSKVLVADVAEGRCRQLMDSFPGQVEFVTTDVTSEASVDQAVAAAVAMGPLRIVLNCAGAGIVQRTLSREGKQHDIGAFRAMVELNLIGTFIVMVRSAAEMARLPVLESGERGVIINTSSLAGLEGSAGQIAYGAAKAGVAGLTLPAARDLGPAAIRVVTIAPGGMGEVGKYDPANPPDSRIQQLFAQIPQGRFGTPDEFALLVTQLVENTYLNGAVFRLDGGARLGLKY